MKLYCFILFTLLVLQGCSSVEAFKGVTSGAIGCEPDQIDVKDIKRGNGYASWKAGATEKYISAVRWLKVMETVKKKKRKSKK